jgi:RNA polymerase sigma-70 factor (ECF subfamily)
VDLAFVLQRCREGDQLAWEALVRSFQGRVYGIACHYLGNSEDARDVAQEIFVRIYQNLGSDIDEQRFVPWMIRICRNACIDHLRRRKARPPAQDILPETTRALVDRRENPEEHWAASSRKRLIYRAMQQLSRLNREIILLKDILGLPLEEISSQLKVPLGTIKSRSNRARIELAEKVLALCNRAGGAR